MSGKNPFLSFGFVSPFMTFIRASISKNLFLGANLDLNFTENLSLIDDISGNNLITFSRASTGTYVDSDGLIKTSPVNLLTYSEQFDNGSYITAGFPVVAPTKTPNQATAPDGSLTADKIDYPAVSEANTYSLIYRNAVTLSGSHSSSIYLRGAVGGEKVYLFYIVDGIYSNTLCTLTTEWQRFSVNFTGGTISYWHLGVDLRAGSGQVAQSASTIYAWGAQVEANASFPTSYIPTTTSAVTRAADEASITGSNFSRWYNQSEGTVFANAICNGLSNGNVSFVGHLFDGTTNNYIDVFRYQPTGFSLVVVGGAVQSGLISSVTRGSYHKSALAYKTNDFSLSVDGASVITDNSGSLPSQSISILTLGNDSSNVRALNGHISRLTYYPKRLPDIELQQLTK